MLQTNGLRKCGDFGMQQTSTIQGKPMEYGIAVYLRNVSTRLDKIGRSCPDARTHEALVAICLHLADKAHIIETSFTIPRNQG